MELKDQLRELLTQGLGQMPSAETLQDCTHLCAREIHRVLGTVVSSTRLSELRDQLNAGDSDLADLLIAEFPWSSQVTDAVVAGVVRRAVENAGAEGPDWHIWPTPPTTLDEGRMLVRDLVEHRRGVGALERWPSLLDAEPRAAHLVTERVEAEAGVRLSLLADRAGTMEVCTAAVDDVVASVVEDSGGAEGLALWGSQLVDVPAETVDGGTVIRVQQWSSTPVAEPVRTANIRTVRFDDEFLGRCGLATLRLDERGPLLKGVYSELELRVGSALSKDMSEEMLTQFEHLLDAKDDQAASAWLVAYRPNYPQLVNEHVAVIEAELREAAPKLLAALGTVPGADAR